MKNIALITIVILIALTGCAEIKPPQNHYYVFNSPHNQQGELISSPASLHIELAQFLAQGALILQLDKQRIQPSHYHRWGEPLAGMIERYLQRQLQQFEQHHKQTTTTIIIDQFHGSPAGDVWLSGQWWDHDVTPPQPQRFSFQAKQGQAGYDGLVVTLQQLLDKLASEIAH